MGCEEKYFELMNRAIDGDLDAGEEAELNAHLAQCGQCRSLYEALKTMAEETAALEAEPPEGMTGKIMAGVRESRKRASRPARITRWIVSVGSAAAVLIMIVFAARVVFTGAGAPAPKEAVADAAGMYDSAESSDTTVAGGSEEYDDSAELAPSSAPVNATSMPMENGEASGDTGSQETLMSAGAAILNTRYDLRSEDYRYVLVFAYVPQQLESEEHETDEEGNFRYTVENALAESLIPDCGEYVDNTNSAEQSLVICG